MEIGRDLQVRAASGRSKAFTWDVEQYLEPVEEVKREPKMKGPYWEPSPEVEARFYLEIVRKYGGRPLPLSSS